MEPIELASDEFPMIRHYIALRFTCKLARKGVDPTRFEPLTSAVQKRQVRLPEVSGACKIPAKTPYLHVGTFLKISGYVLRLLHGCCTDTVRRDSESRRDDL
jgi:hypothetical protein